jgi:cell division control protein 6
MLSADETLFRNEEIFDFSYIPDQFAHRDDQLKSLAMCIKPALRGAKPINAILCGPPATGKTTAIKIVFQQLEETTEKIVTVHMNCQIYSSAFRIFSEIHKKIIGYLPPETGVPLSNIYDKIFQKLSKDEKTLIVALDDLNYANNELLYDILRAYEAYPKARTAAFAVLLKDEIHKLDDKVRSVFQPMQINFPPYNKDEIFNILKKRSEIGFYPNVISDELIRKISLQTVKNDLRFGIALLRQSALQAEKNASRKIREEDVNNALSSITIENNKLQKTDEIILDILENGALQSGDLYKSLKKKVDTSYSGFYRTLEKLKAMNLIEMNEVDLKKGKTRIISKRGEI